MRRLEAIHQEEKLKFQEALEEQSQKTTIYHNEIDRLRDVIKYQTHMIAKLHSTNQKLLKNKAGHENRPLSEQIAALEAKRVDRTKYGLQKMIIALKKGRQTKHLCPIHEYQYTGNASFTCSFCLQHVEGMIHECLCCEKFAGESTNAIICERCKAYNHKF